jgi:cytochrome P450
MRLKSVFPILFLGTNQDVQLGGVQIPEGTAIFLLTRKGGMQESEFIAADRFQPERWLSGGTCPTGGHNPKAFVPFGAGPRFCPGRNLALLEMKAAIAMLCKNFSVHRSADAPPVEEHFEFLMAPKHLAITLTPRMGKEVRQDRLNHQSTGVCPVAVETL